MFRVAGELVRRRRRGTASKLAGYTKIASPAVGGARIICFSSRAELSHLPAAHHIRAL